MLYELILINEIEQRAKIIFWVYDNRIFIFAWTTASLLQELSQKRWKEKALIAKSIGSLLLWTHWKVKFKAERMKATDANHTPWKTSAKKELQKQPLKTSVKRGKESVNVHGEGANNSRL